MLAGALVGDAATAAMGRVQRWWWLLPTVAGATGAGTTLALGGGKAVGAAIYGGAMVVALAWLLMRSAIGFHLNGLTLPLAPVLMVWIGAAIGIAAEQE